MAKNYKLYSKRIASAERIDELYDVVKKINNQLGPAKLDLSKELNWTDTAPSGDDEEHIVIPSNSIDVTKLYDEIGQIADYNNTTAVYHKIFDGNSVVSDSSFNMTGYIPVHGGEVFSIYGYIDESKAIVVGYDADKLNPSAIVNVLTLSKAINDKVIDDTVYNSTTKLVNGFSFIIPEGITYIRYAACNATHSNYNAHRPMLPQIAVVSEDVLKKYNDSGNIVNNFIHENSYLNTTGYKADIQTDYIVTGSIPVIENKRYVISGAVSIGWPVVVGKSKAQDEPVIILNAASLQGSPYYNTSGMFNRYLLEIPSDVTHIIFSAKGANHPDNSLHVVPKIECYDYQDSIHKDNEEPIDVSDIIPVTINWKNIVAYPDIAADAYAGGANIVKGAVLGDDLLYHGVLNIISTTLGGVDYTANVFDENDPTIITKGHDYKHVTGYIPIVDENDKPIYSVIAITVYPYIGSKTPQSVICVGYKEVENNNSADVRHSNGVNNRLVIKGNPYFKYSTYKSIVIGDNGKPVISSPELDEDFNGYNSKEAQTYYINLLPYVSKGIKYIRVCSRYRIPKTVDGSFSSWENLSDMDILGYPYKEGISETKANAFVEETNATVKVNQVKRNAQQVILDEITSKLETEQDIVDTLQLLKDAPREYLSNINTSRLFGTTNRRNIVRRYLEDVENGSLDCPNVIKDITTVSLYPTLSPRISKASVTELTNMLIPNARYYIADGKNVKKFDVVGERRFINGGTIRNIRDLGGIKCKGGNTIAFDKVFRGAAIDDDSYHFLGSLGITAELDLRNVDEGYNEQHYSFTTRYKKTPMPSFTRLSTLSSEQKANIKEAFLFVNDCVKHNNKLYIHCAIGCHRAGLLSAIIEGVLGAHRSEIDKDYELSAFSGYTLSVSDDYDYDNAYNDLVANYDSSWTNFLLDCGVPYERIVEFRNNMLIYPNKEQIVQYHIVTYNQLVNLRNNKGLIPGDKYRMIDYDTEVYQLGHFIGCSGVLDDLPANSAYHRFDLLLTALSTSELDCNVKALHSVRDTEGYFAQTDLSKWELKYDLDNDKTKYNWAVEGGKGVIYYMKDENNNELPYDFKNVLFSKNDIDMHTFNYNSITHTLTEVIPDSESVSVEDVSTDDVNKFRITGGGAGRFTAISSTNRYVRIKNNSETSVTINGVEIASDDTAICDVIIGCLYTINNNSSSIDITVSEIVQYGDAQASNVVIKPYLVGNVQYLNNIVFITEDANDKITDCFVDVNSHDNSFIGDAINVSVGKYCSQNEIENAENFVLKDNCNKINIKNSAKNTTIGKDCYQITITNNATALVVADYVSDKTATTTENTYVSVPNGISFVTISE